MLPRAIVFAFLLIVCARSPAFANADGDALEAAGLIGTWAVDCAAKSRVEFLKFKGPPRRRSRLQDGSDLLISLKNVRRDGNRTSFSYEFGGFTYSNVWETAGNKVRIVELYANTDKVPKVTKGISERTGAPSPWAEKCSNMRKPVDYIESGQMVMIQDGQKYIVLDGWDRNHGDYSVQAGECNIQVRGVNPDGTFQMSGQLMMALDGSGVMADADNCRWEFAKDITFTKGQVLVHAKQGATVEFDRNRVITTGITFSEKE